MEYEEHEVIPKAVTKEAMEKIWERPGVLYAGNRVIWKDYLGKPIHKPGEALNPKVGKEAEKFVRKCLSHSPGPIGDSTKGQLQVPKWLRERYRKECPNNYKALIAAYGKTRTKYDAPYN